MSEGSAPSRRADSGFPEALVWPLAVASFLLGAAASLLGLAPRLHALDAWLGIVGVAAGLPAQMFSTNTGQRWFAIVGLTFSALGAFFGIAHGGLT